LPRFARNDDWCRFNARCSKISEARLIGLLRSGIGGSTSAMQHQGEVSVATSQAMERPEREMLKVAFLF
jgi:hypothetical protein